MRKAPTPKPNQQLVSLPAPQLPAPFPEAATRYREIGLQGAANTQRAYSADLRSYEAYCQSQQLAAYPAEVATLGGYLAHLADAGKKLATILRHQAAILKKHELLGLRLAGDERALKQVLRGITLSVGKRQKRAPAFTAAHLKSVIRQLDLSTVAGLRDRALLLLGYAGAFRRSELVALNLEDLELTDQALVMHLRRSKTNQAGELEQKAVFYAANPLFCPIRAYQAWVAQLGGRLSGPLFVSLQRGVQAGASTPTLRRLSDKSVNNLVRQHLGGQYTAHSFRASFVTVSKLNGVDDTHVMNQTKHKTSEMIRRYTRLSDVVEHNAAQNIDL
ncbi:MAG: tyrosine-type recombinase/integrase [Janthinobacterium lividum]